MAQTPGESPEVILRRGILAAASQTGGWAYYGAKTARLEPTAWALLALWGSDTAALKPHADFLTGCQRPNGWLAEDEHWPINIAFNALVTFTWHVSPALASDDNRRRLLTTLMASKGIKVQNEPNSAQDNSLQGWPWLDATFSWVEPTSWGVLALKKARRAGTTGAEADARIAEADRLLLDRTCKPGGWNFGNAAVLNQDLRPYVPTTALALLALQDRAAEPAVKRSVEFLEQHWGDEISATSLGLSLLALDVYGRPIDRLVTALRGHAGSAVAFGNVHGMAVALCALARHGKDNVFRM